PLNCPACPAGQVCGGGGIANVCAQGASCPGMSCNDQTGKQLDCGMLGDGCGRPLNCPGSCPAGQQCGAVTAHVCGPDQTLCQSTKITSCTLPNNEQYCGTIGDNCGHELVCPSTCPAGKTCNSNHLCVPTSCPNPAVCVDNTGKQLYCGDIGDGCGNTLHCAATCPSGFTCGGPNNSRPGVCFPNSCTGLCLNQVSCPNNGDTTITGKVVAPNGMDPVYNALVYIPNGMVQNFVDGPGTTCQSCTANVTGNPLVSDLTKADGTFTLKAVPVGVQIPVVVQLGRWRLRTTLPTVATADQCKAHPLAGQPAIVLRLPKNRNEGDIPKTAFATGRVDHLECVLRKMGIE